MRFAGIDIASELHVAAVVDEACQTLVRPTPFGEDAAGYVRVRELLGTPDDVLVAMEATGHYWQNLFAVLVAEGFRVALLNPLRTHRFAGEDLRRTKTDAIDALGIASFAAQKRPPATRLPDDFTRELRELVRLRARLQQDFEDRVRHLHRLVDLGFPELSRHIRALGSELATTILRRYPTAHAFQDVTIRRLASLRYHERRRVGNELATTLIAAARTSVGQHHETAYQVQVRYLCEDLDVLRQRLRDLTGDLERSLHQHQVGTLLTSIEGIGPLTAARIVGELGDPAQFRSAAALASYVGVAPGQRHSGKRHPRSAPLSPIGHAMLRRALWMPTLVAVRKNLWLRAYYERLRAAGKPPKVALVAAMRKLLIAVYSVAKTRRPFVPIVPVTT